MSQYDFGTINPATTSGTALATLLGSFRTALESQHSGSSRPAYAIAGMIWLDTTSTTPAILKFYDGTDDITIGTLNYTTNVFAVTAGAPTFTLVDAGATVGPSVDNFRDSSSPLAADVIGSYDFNGRDSAGNKQLYVRMQAVIDDPTSTSEDARFQYLVAKAGTVSLAFETGSNYATITGSSNVAVLNTGADTNSLTLQGGNTGSTGGQWVLYGNTHSTSAHDVQLMSNNVERYSWDFSALKHIFTGDAYISGTTRFVQNSTDVPGNGNNTVGASIRNDGRGHFSASTLALNVNVTSDGQLVQFYSGGTAQGGISVAGATVTYGAFNGSHEAQLAVESDRKRLLCGTILESVDVQSQWGDKPDWVLPKIKISDTPGSKRVYGVFFDWYGADPKDDTANSSSLGAYVIRIAKGVKVEGGDLIESNGDGCGRVMTDHTLSAIEVQQRLIAKITSNVIAGTYPDGSYLVPCTLHCG